MKTIFITLVLLLASCQSSGSPDCTIGQCGDERATANDLVDKAQFDQSETTIIPMPDPGEQVVFTGAITAESQPFTLQAEAGDWLEIGIYSLGLPAPGLKMSDDYLFHSSTPIHKEGSVSRIILIPEDQEYSLEPYSNLDRLQRVTESTHLPFVAYVKRIEPPPATPLLYINSEPQILDLFAPPSLHLIDPSAAGAFQVTIESQHQAQSILLYSGDPTSPDLLIAPTDASSIIIGSEQNTWIYIDYQEAHRDRGEVSFCFEPVNRLDVGASQETPIEAEDHSILRVFHGGHDIHYLDMTLLRGEEPLLEARSFYHSGDDLFVAEGGPLTLRTTNNHNYPIDAYELFVETIRPEQLGSLTTDNPLEINLFLPFSEEDIIYFLIEIEEDNTLFQARITSEEYTPELSLHGGADTFEINEMKWLSADWELYYAESDIVTSTAGLHLIRLEKPTSSTQDQHIQLTLTAAEPLVPFSSSESIEFQAGDIVVFQHHNGQDLPLELTISRDAQILEGPHDIETSGYFLYFIPEDGLYDIHWQGPQSFKPLFADTETLLLDPTNLGAIALDESITVDTSNLSPGSHYYWLSTSEDLFISSSSDENLTVYLHEESNLIDPQTRAIHQLSKTFSPGTSLIEISNNTNSVPPEHIELIGQTPPHIFSSSTPLYISESWEVAQNQVTVDHCDSPTHIGIQPHLTYEGPLSLRLAISITNPQGITRHLHNYSTPIPASTLHTIFGVDTPTLDSLAPLIDPSSASGEWTLELSSSVDAPVTLHSWSLLLWCDS